MNLGKLARWLRLLGFDVLYTNDKTDAEVVADSVRDTRVVLTRDRAHFLKNVLRAHVGETVGLFNGRDGEWLAEQLDRAIAAFTKVGRQLGVIREKGNNGATDETTLASAERGM